MSANWLTVLGILLMIALILLFLLFQKLRRQNILIRIQSDEIQRQIRELKVQNQIQEGLNYEKKQLISLVSHDLKGPFNRIFALTQLIEMGATNLTDDQKEYIGKIFSIVTDGLNMVRNLVDARKMEDQGFDLKPEPVDLANIMNSIVTQYRVMAEKKKISIDYTSPGKVEWTADKAYTSRIIENLISNAVKFSPPGKSVYITLQKLDDIVEFVFRDEGPGITAEDQLQLYQKFKKLTARPTGGESSTGLGLAIVHHLVKTMGGEIICESVVDVGTSFTIRIPQKI